MSENDLDFIQNKLLLTPAPDFSQSEIRNLIEKSYGLTGSLSPLGSERDQNFKLVSATGEPYVIKIANSADDQAIIDLQIKALQHISQVDPDFAVPKVHFSQTGKAIQEVAARDGRKHNLRIVTYLPGIPPTEILRSSRLNFQIGACLARMTRALQGFFHPAANYDLLWDLKQASKLRNYLDYIPDPDHREMATYFLDRFDRNISDKLPKLRAQIVHNDLVPDNLLVARDDPSQIVGVIDFGDLIHTNLVIDLATTIAASLRGAEDPQESAAQILAGYTQLIPLEDQELRILYDLIGVRLSMLNVIASWRVTIHPENQDYIMGGVEKTWQILKIWRGLDPEKVTQMFFRVCGKWELEEPGKLGARTAEDFKSLLTRRQELLGPFAYLFYEQPLHIVRGEGVWLYDADGTKYLDAYNNVPQVGHCHPHVVNAISRQARVLNTSTRYLHDYILELAERITDRLPPTLSVCTFVCTGSEANELAWRMAQLVTGNSGALISQYSYHGSTGATVQFSTENLPKGKLPAHVKTISAPQSNTAWKEPDSGIQDAIRALDADGHQPAMLILDTSFVSDGIFTSPSGYLKKLAAQTRKAGGLFVADEVQGGYGRFGKHFWGFEFDDVIPDIVTIGKPMGNGHPLAAVVTRPEIAEALAKDTGYFNTFGGNPVSCAAGLAVLDVIEKESLQGHALQVGQYLVDRLEDLRKDYPVLGPTHGSGLLLGVDILDRNGDPNPQAAGKIMNQMRGDGVLIGTTGPQSQTLKIRPPLVFEEQQADILLQALKNALDEI